MRTDEKVQRALERTLRVPPPRGLLRKLLAIPDATPRAHTGWRWIAMPAALAGVAAVAWMLAPGPRAPEPSPENTLAAEAAVRDFTLAMTYLQKSTAIAGRHAGNEIGSGMLGALALSRNALLDDETNNGG